MMCQFLRVKTKLGTKYFVQSSSIAAAAAAAAAAAVAAAAAAPAAAAAAAAAAVGKIFDRIYSLSRGPCVAL